MGFSPPLAIAYTKFQRYGHLIDHGTSPLTRLGFADPPSPARGEGKR
jgi:hypothetical protein